MINFIHGMSYYLRGLRTLRTPGLKRFIIIPIAFNCILFSGLFYLAYHYLLPYAYHYMDKLPHWLSFLSTVLVILFVIVFLLLFLAMFTVMFNVFAAPFNGLLAEKVQKIVYGRSVPPVAFSTMAIRSLKRQAKFLRYFIPRFLGMGILFFVPFIQPIFPVIWFLFTAWMLSMQFQDIPQDNNLVGFEEMKEDVKTNRMRSLGFGSAISLGSFIPFFNLLTMSAAVIGSTLLYCDTHLEESLALDKNPE